MNCHKLVAPDDAKLFAEVFICPDCYVQAEHFWLRLDKELRYLLVMAKEAIRIALIEGKFAFNEAGRDAHEISKRDVLEEIMRMTEAKEAAEVGKYMRGGPVPAVAEETARYIRSITKSARLDRENQVISSEDVGEATSLLGLEPCSIPIDQTLATISTTNTPLNVPSQDVPGTRSSRT